MGIAGAAVIGFALLGKVIEIQQGKQLDQELEKLDNRINNRKAASSSE